MEKNVQRDSQDVTAKLMTLGGLTEDDITEAGLLKCRIEQQAELICILKQRADEYLKKYMEVEDKTASIQTEMAAFAIKYEEERKSHEVLKDRFNTLDRNHVEMIKLKDEYKAGNEILRYDNERLKSDNENLFSESISEKDKVIAKLNDDLQKLQSKLDKAEEKEREFADIRNGAEKDLVDLKCALDEEKAARKGNVEELEKKLNLGQSELLSMKNALEESNKKMKLQEQTNEFHEQRYLDYQRQTEELVRQLDSEKDRVRVLEQRLKKESEASSTNATIRRLSAEIHDANQLKLKLIREFDAYKKHTSNLLNRERELNAKLRRLNIP